MMGQNSTWHWGYCFSSGRCCSEGSDLPKQDDWCCMGDDSALNPGGYSPSCLSNASVPRLSSSILSPLLPTLARVY